MTKTLVILAAGMGSRFGGIKQLEPVGPDGEIIMDYSVHDALAAGFNKIIFIIRRDIEAEFREIIGARLENVCRRLGAELHYVFQDIRDVPIPVPEGRTKPWGTGHAVLSCGELLSESFAVINSDDYYGKSAFQEAAGFLPSGQMGLVGYELGQTLSETGGVTRGICTVENGRLVSIRETRNLTKSPEGPVSNGRFYPENTLVSMNFWCFPASFGQLLRAEFPVFLKNMTDPCKDEFLLPVVADRLLRSGTEIRVLHSRDRWVGVTYVQDKPAVSAHFRSLYEEGVYLPRLYEDLLPVGTEE